MPPSLPLPLKPDLLVAFLFAFYADAESPRKAVSNLEKHRADSDAFFSVDGPVAELSFAFAPEELAKLRKGPGNSAEAMMTEAGLLAIDQKPRMTLSLKKFPGGERFHGMERFHLNHALQRL